MLSHKHVIGHYYRERCDNLTRIIEQLNHDAIKPLIWNNSERLLSVSSLLYYDVVNCVNNPIHGRYLAALIHPEHDVFVFQDDDLILNEDTIVRLVAAASYDHNHFHGVEGNSMDQSSLTPYASGRRVRAPETECDMVIRAYACHRSILKHGFDWILEHGIHPGRSETLLFTGGRSRLVPETSWEDLPENGVGLCHDKNHDAEIDRFIDTWGMFQPA